MSRFYTFGVTNRLPNGKYLPFFDIDGNKDNPKQLLEPFKQLQEDHELGDLLVISTKNGYHVVSLKPVSKKKFIDLLENSPSDELYIEKAKQQGYSVLRIAPKFDIVTNGIVNPKPFYLLTIPSYDVVPLSLGHYKFFKHIYMIPDRLMPQGWFMPNTSKIAVIYYRTLKE